MVRWQGVFEGCFHLLASKSGVRGLAAGCLLRMVRAAGFRTCGPFV